MLRSGANNNLVIKDFISITQIRDGGLRMKQMRWHLA
jgi:hypothetical protein